MKGISKFYTAIVISALGSVLTVALFSCQTTSSQQIIDDGTIKQTNTKFNQEKAKATFENEQVGCLNAEFPKRKDKYIISAGVINIKAIDIPKPEYPAKAKTEKIDGEIKASIFVNESGKVIWARVDNGHPLLQEAVKKVLCQPIFKPATISGHPYAVSGFIIYKFVLPE